MSDDARAAPHPTGRSLDGAVSGEVRAPLRARARVASVEGARA